MSTVFRFCVAAILVSVLPSARANSGEPGDRYALLIGVREYPDAKDLRTLPYSENDVTTLARVLQDSGFKKENVVLMTQARGAGGGRYLPLKRRINTELEVLLDGRNPEDTIVVALAGHGVHFKGEKESYFCPADARLDDKETLISLAEIYKQLDSCPAAVRMLFVDACRNDPFVSNSRSRVTVSLESITRPDLPAPARGMAAFFSCSEKERAYEAEKLRHGVFFHFVIEGFKGKAADKYGDVSALRLGDYVSRRVKDYVRKEYGVSQRPDLVGKNLGEMPLMRLGKLFGQWTGYYHYPEGDKRPPVKFELKIAQDGARLSGSSKEPNTFWEFDTKVDKDEPNLFATWQGRFNEEASKVSFTKTYDGTAGVSHSVIYSGPLNNEGNRIEGKWVIRTIGKPDFSGRFTLKKAATADD